VTYVLERADLVPSPRDEVFEFFSDPRNLARITPDGMGFKITHIDELPIRPDFRIEYTIRPLLGIPVKWVTRISIFEPPYRFVDVQEKGPYRYWRHEHCFDDLGDQTLMRDCVQYELPFGILGSVAHRIVVARQLKSIFDYRARKIASIFAPSKTPVG
jgi:ligand-binding SRPBCC domain-containing protein